MCRRGVGMDIIVCYGFQVHIGKTGEAHEEKHVSHGTLAFVFQLHVMILCNSSSVRKDLFLYSGLHSKDVKGWTRNQPFSCAMYIGHFRVLTRLKAVAFALPAVPSIHV